MKFFLLKVFSGTLLHFTATQPPLVYEQHVDAVRLLIHLIWRENTSEFTWYRRVAVSGSNFCRISSTDLNLFTSTPQSVLDWSHMLRPREKRASFSCRVDIIAFPFILKKWRADKHHTCLSLWFFQPSNSAWQNNLNSRSSYMLFRSSQLHVTVWVVPRLVSNMDLLRSGMILLLLAWPRPLPIPFFCLVDSPDANWCCLSFSVQCPCMLKEIYNSTKEVWLKALNETESGPWVETTLSHTYWGKEWTSMLTW